MTEEIVRRYSNGEITVVWRPRLCTHVGPCFRELPAVFRPARRPWVDISGADTATIVRQVERCPSGALSCFRNGEQPTADTGAAALCRCGRSRNKPYCDGSHSKVGFDG